MWKVKHASSSGHAEIAWLQMELARTPVRAVDQTPLPMNLIPPPAGAPVFALGFRSGEIIPVERRLETATQPLRSSGCVLDVYPEYRDRVMMPYPCFSTTAMFEDTISGGPVFTSDGMLCGLVSIGTDVMPDGDPEAHLSWAALLWSSLATTLADGQLVYDLARTGALHARGWTGFDPADVTLSGPCP